MGSKKQRRDRQMPIMRPHAAGMDIGAEEIYVAVPGDHDDQPIRSFGTFTCELHALADWLQQYGIDTVAMESTGVYWIPIFQILESRGFEVFSVNAHYLKSVPGRKSDVSDCQWIQYLHSVGLLQGSFRPPDKICAVRTLWRHRQSLLQMAAEHILHMQKSLSLMNVQIHHVLSDITGLSGLAILDAILAGERDSVKLAQLCHCSVKSPRDKIVQSLEGDYRPEHLFVLQQSLAGYRYYQQSIAELDREIERLMKAVSNSEGVQELPLRTKRTKYQRQVNDPGFGLRRELYRIAGVDLTDIPGVSTLTAQVILTEIGPDVSRFRNASAFASWHGLCPENAKRRQMLSCKTRKVKSRAALALRLEAHSLCRAKDYFGEFFRRMRAKLGTAQATTATAHKMARIIYHVLRTKTPYNETAFYECDEQARQRAENRLRKKASEMGFQLVPTVTAASQ
jgi:Transposase IS116/IS110/IS902 family./Transposase.